MGVDNWPRAPCVYQFPHASRSAEFWHDTGCLPGNLPACVHRARNAATAILVTIVKYLSALAPAIRRMTHLLAASNDQIEIRISAHAVDRAWIAGTDRVLVATGVFRLDSDGTI